MGFNLNTRYDLTYIHHSMLLNEDSISKVCSYFNKNVIEVINDENLVEFDLSLSSGEVILVPITPIIIINKVLISEICLEDQIIQSLNEIGLLENTFFVDEIVISFKII